MTDYLSGMFSFPVRPSRGDHARGRFTSARALGAAFVGIVAIAACKSTSATDPAVSAAAGNYVLRTINDTVLPYTVSQSSTYRRDITADTLRIGLDGAFLDVTRFRLDSIATTFPADTLTGVIQVSGTTVTFLVGSQVLAAGSLSGSTLTLSGNGARSVYTR
jgi:hypothetical protein